MRSTYLPIMNGIFLAILMTSLCSAGSGIFGAYVQLGTNWYGGLQWGSNSVASLNSAFIGSFHVGDSLIVADAELHTWMNSGTDVTNASYYWRATTNIGDSWLAFPFHPIDLGLTAEAPFNSAASGNRAEGTGDRNWSEPSIQSNILAGLVPGNYTLESYFVSLGTDGAHIANLAFLDEPFRASFTLLSAIPTGQTVVVINHFDAPGRIVFDEQVNASSYKIEWSSSAGNAWTSFAAAASALDSIPPSGFAAVTAQVPMLYRVVAVLTNAP